jgi:predicted RNase H-like nuclease
MNAGLQRERGWVAGVDGYRHGWVIVLADPRTGVHSARVVPTFVEVLSLPEGPEVIAVDVPIGLLSVAKSGGRECEQAARRLLGKRQSSVFSAPTRGALDAYRAGGSYRVVSAANGGGVPDAPGISQQTFGILNKIDEVDQTINPSAQARVVEVHPELSFCEANRGRPMSEAKKTPEGRAERDALLTQLGFVNPLRLFGERRPKGVKADDLLDACIACWTAARVVSQTAIVIPQPQPYDDLGLKMELWR